jgi:integrase/recombinase XerD
MQAKAPLAAPLSGAARAFLDFCRVEKGLAANSLSSYRSDLQRLSAAVAAPLEAAGAERLGAYVESLYQVGMSARSVARHIATLRNFYGFLAGRIRPSS